MDTHNITQGKHARISDHPREDPRQERNPRNTLPKYLLGSFFRYLAFNFTQLYQDFITVPSLCVQFIIKGKAGLKMRLVRFSHNGSTRIGAEVSQNGDIVDISAVDESIPNDTRLFLDAGESALLAARRSVDHSLCLINLISKFLCMIVSIKM